MDAAIKTVIQTLDLGSKPISLTVTDTDALRMRELLGEVGCVFILANFSFNKDPDGTVTGNVLFEPGNGIIEVGDYHALP